MDASPSRHAAMEFTWEVTNFSMLLDRPVYSAPFEIGTFIWRLKLYPTGLGFGVQDLPGPSWVSLFLVHDDSSWLPPNLVPKATFRMTAINQTGAAENISKETRHRWYQDAEDWGFTQFIPIEDALDPDRGFTLDDTLKIKVEIQVQNEQQQDGHLYCRVKVVTDQDIQQQVAARYFELCDPNSPGPDRQFKLLRTTPFSTFQQQVEGALGVPVSQQRFWTWHRRANGTWRPKDPLKGVQDKTLLDLRQDRLQPGQEPGDECDVAMELLLYLETAMPQAPLQESRTRHEVCLHFKYYDWQNQTLRYVGHKNVHKSSKVSDLFPFMRQLAGLPSDAQLLAFEEVKFHPVVMVPALNPNQILEDPDANGRPTFNQISSGDIICFQIKPSAEAAGPSAAAAGVAAAAAAAAMDTAVSEAGSGGQQQQQQDGTRALTVDVFLQRAEDRIQALVRSQVEPHERHRQAMAAARDAARDRAAAAAARERAAPQARLRWEDIARAADDRAARMETDDGNADEAVAAASQLAGDGDGDGEASASASESPRYGGRPERWSGARASRDALQQRIAEQSVVITGLRQQVAQLQQQVAEAQSTNANLSTQLQAAMALHHQKQAEK